MVRCGNSCISNDLKFKSLLANIHVFQNNRKYYFFEKNSLIFFEIDLIIKSGISLLKKGGFEGDYLLVRKKPNPSMEKAMTLINQLVKRNIISIHNNISDQFELMPKQHLTVFLPISRRCNLSCSYCLSKFYDKSVINQRLSIDTFKEAIDFIFFNYKERELIFNFFGGEPLLEFTQIKVLSKYIMNKAINNNQKVIFCINTNGTKLTKQQLTFLKKLNFKLCFSLDGPKKLHDMNRPYKNGKSSFKKTIDNIRLARKCYPVENLRIASIYKPKSSKLFYRMKYLTKLGIPFVTYQKAKLADVDDAYIDISQIKSIEKEERNICKMIYSDIINRNLNCIIEPIFYTLVPLLTRKPQLERLCEAGVNNLTFSADRNIYPCYWLEGNQESIIGSIDNGVEESKLKKWRKYLEEEELECRSCFAENICAHGCMIEKYLFKRKDVLTCHIMRKRIEMCIELIANLRDNDKEYLIDWLNGLHVKNDK